MKHSPYSYPIQLLRVECFSGGSQRFAKDSANRFWFKNKWRKMESHEPICADSNRYRIRFSGLAPRIMNGGIRLYVAFQPDLKAIEEDRWYGQKNGPDFYSGVPSYYMPRKMTYDNPSWINHYIGKHNPSYANKMLWGIKKRNIAKEFFSKRFPRLQKVDMSCDQSC